jgi:hypothetical protein
MKFLLLLSLFFNCLCLCSQPVLAPVYQMPDPPDLTLDQLIQYEDIITFAHPEGIILYNHKEDQWKLFRFLDQYEEYGRIRKIQKINDRIIVSLEKGGVILANSRTTIFKESILETIAFKNKLLIFSSELNPEENQDNSFDEYDYYEADQFILFDPVKNSTETIKLSRSIYKISSCELIGDKIWIFSIDLEAEYFNPELLRVDLDGNVTKVEYPEINKDFIRSLNSYKDRLYVLCDSALFYLPENKPPVRLPGIDPPDGKKVFKTAAGFLVFPHGGDDTFFDTIRFSRINLKSETMEPFSYIEPRVTPPGGFNDYLMDQNTLFCYSDYMQMVFSIEPNQPYNRKGYAVRDGITGYISNFAEDDKEAWFVSSLTGFYRFSKTDSTWTTYKQYINYQSDSADYLSCGRISLNEDFVFFPLSDIYGNIRQFLLFERKNETFKLLTHKEFVNKFFYCNERFSKYNGDDFIGEKYSGALSYLIPYILDWSTWNLLLFLYDLPVSGNEGGEYANQIIRGENYSILSFYAYFPGPWQNGIIYKNKDNDVMKIIYAPENPENFEGTIVPLYIGGDDKKVMAASWGNFSHGMLVYDFQDGTCKSEKNWAESFDDVGLLKNAGKYIMVGNFWRSIFAIDKSTYEMTSLGKYMSGRPYTCQSTDKYIYISTENELVYFDHDLNYLGKLYSGQCDLTKSQDKLYLNTREKIFLIIE